MSVVSPRFLLARGHIFGRQRSDKADRLFATKCRGSLRCGHPMVAAASVSSPPANVTWPFKYRIGLPAAARSRPAQPLLTDISTMRWGESALLTHSLSFRAHKPLISPIFAAPSFLNVLRIEGAAVSASPGAVTALHGPSHSTFSQASRRPGRRRIADPAQAP